MVKSSSKKLILTVSFIVSVILFATVSAAPYAAIQDWHHLDVASANQVAPSIESCDSLGTPKNVFYTSASEIVYVNGSGYPSSSTFDFYIVSDILIWANGTPIPTRAPDTAVNVSSDSSGNISPVTVWSVNLTSGMFDAVVDVNSNGLYDESIDALDDYDLIFAGFMIPYEGPPDWLYVTTATDNPLYGLTHPVSITGNLTSNDGPVENALVAIEVRDSANIPVTFRTKPTGPSPRDNWPINFTQLFASTSDGNPKLSYDRGALLLISFAIKNHGAISRDVLVCISVYDENMVPIMSDISYSTYLEAYQTAVVTKSVDVIQNWAALGTATIYGSIYSDLPKNGGYPYCSEQQATFTITSQGSSSMAASTSEPIYVSETAGTYNLSFNIPPEARAGDYTVSTSSYYYGLQDVDSAVFEVEIIGDINEDGWVELTDFFLLSLAFGSSPGQPNWDPRADIAPWPDGDGQVELLDFFLTSQHFGEHIPQP